MPASEESESVGKNSSAPVEGKGKATAKGTSKKTGAPGRVTAKAGSMTEAKRSLDTHLPNLA